jgi:hypothetical protein
MGLTEGVVMDKLVTIILADALICLPNDSPLSIRLLCLPVMYEDELNSGFVELKYLCFRRW